MAKATVVKTPEATESPETPTESTGAQPKVKTAVQDTMITSEFQAPPVLPGDLPVTPTETGEDNTVTTQAEAEPQPQTLTQAEIDKIIASRLKQERSKYADYGDLKAKVEAFEAEKKVAEEAQKTEAEKLAEKLAALESEKAKLAEQARSAQISAAITAEAAAIGLDAKAALKLADLAALTFENGSIANAAEVVKAVAEEYPQLIKRTPQPQTAAVNPAKTAEPARDDNARRREYFGGNYGNFWNSGGVRTVNFDQ